MPHAAPAATRRALFLLLLLAACDSPTAPWPEPPAETPRIARIEEWFSSDANPVVQRGEFEYDDAGRLARYTFGIVQADGSLRVTMVVDYEYTAGRLAHTELRVRDGEEFVLVRESEYTYDGAGRIVLRRTFTLNESTGAVVVSETTFEVDAAARIVSETTGSGQERFVRDSRGNVVRHESLTDGVVNVVTSYSYEPSFNPFPEGGQWYEGVILNSHLGFGPYNISGWSSGEPGKGSRRLRSSPSATS